MSFNLVEKGYDKCPDCGCCTYSLHYSKSVEWKTKNYSIPERYCHNCKRVILFEIKEVV